MSTTGTFKIGDTVTLLLGRNNTVAAVIDPTSAGTNTYGIVLATGIASYTDAQGKPYTAPYVKILGVDGVTYQYQTDKSGYYKEGDLVKVAFESGVAKLSRLNNSSKNLSGTVNSAATQLGSMPLASGVRIMDYADGHSANIAASRLAGVKIDSGDVAYYELNSAGEIETLILKNVTGDMYSFGMLTKDDEIPGANMTNGHIYTLMSNGSVVGPLTCEGVSFPVSQGKAVRYMMDGTTLDKMYNLTEVKLTAATTNGTAVAVNGQKFDISTGVQIYLKQNQSGVGTQYYVTSLDKLNSGDYSLTGWYDKPESSGGRMRIIVATPR